MCVYVSVLSVCMSLTSGPGVPSGPLSPRSPTIGITMGPLLPSPCREGKSVEGGGRTRSGGGRRRGSGGERRSGSGGGRRRGSGGGKVEREKEWKWRREKEGKWRREKGK